MEKYHEDLPVWATVIDSVRMLRDNIAIFLQVAAIIYLPLAFITQSSWPVYGGLFWYKGLIIVLGLVYFAMQMAFIPIITEKLYYGRRVYLGEVLTAAFSRAIPMLWTGLLSMLAIGIGFILLIVPGFLAIIRLSLASSVAALRSQSGFSALKYSNRLVKGDGFTIFLILLASIVPTIILQLAAELIIWIMRLALSAILPSATVLITGLLGGFLNILISCLTGICLTLTFIKLEKLKGEEEPAPTIAAPSPPPPAQP